MNLSERQRLPETEPNGSVLVMQSMPKTDNQRPEQAMPEPREFVSGFERHGIRHLSASQINTFAANPAKWAADKLFGLPFQTSPAMMRGTVVEDAVDSMLRGETYESAVGGAEEQYDQEFGDADDDKTRKERGYIGGMVDEAFQALKDFGAPKEKEVRGDRQIQQKVERKLKTLDGIEVPLIGYIDFFFPEHNVIIDLKTSAQIKNAMPPDHQRQGVCYTFKSGPVVRFCYVTPRKHTLLDIPNTGRAFQSLRWHATRLERMLRRFSEDELKMLLPVNLDDFRWFGNEQAAESIYGVPAL